MTDFPFDGIGFDLDGTLLDTFRDLGAAVNHALRLGGFTPVPVDNSKGLVGRGAKIMLARAITAQGGIAEDEFRLLYKAMLEFYAENIAVYTSPYPHVQTVLQELATRGVQLAVVTNKFEEFARKVLSELGLTDHFVAIIGGDSMGRGPDGKFLAKPAPDPVIEARKRCGGAQFAFVGDSTYDVHAARAAGVPIIGAAYGYCDRAPAELGADALIDSLEELIPMLEGFGNRPF